MKNIRVNKKGFTLIELIVAIAILGIITMLALPSIRNVQEKNSAKKYETYQKSLISSAKLYVDSYSEDMFGVNKSGCYDISYSKLKEKKLVKDINVADVKCDGASAEKQTFVRVYRSIDSYTYKAEVYCKDKNNNIVYENTFERGTEVCDGTTEDKAGPKITFSPNELGYNEETGRKAIYIYIKDSYGLEANQKFSYQWYNAKTKQPIGDTVTAELDNNKHTTENPVTSTHLKVSLPSGTGEYYLEVHPITIRDVNGNYTYDDVTSGIYKRDKEAPTLIIRAYRKSGDTKTGEVLAQAEANNTNRKAELNIDWVNYNEGIYFEIEYSDNIAVSKREWSINGVSSGVISIPEDELTSSSVYINAEGKTKAYYKVKDIAGNTSQINIEVAIDTTAPKVPTVKLYKWSNNSTTPTSESGLSSYTSGEWSNKKIYTKVSGSTTESSGDIYYQYTTTGATTNVTNKNGSSRNIEAQGISTIKYRACDQLGNCSDYTEPITIKVDYTSPELKINVYSLNSKGSYKPGSPLVSVTADSKKTVELSEYPNMKNGWLNKNFYPYGIYYQIIYSDNISVKTRKWSWNTAGLIKTDSYAEKITKTTGEISINSSAEEEVSDYVTLSADGYRKAYFEVKDQAGNTAKVKIIAPIDKTSPTCTTSGGSTAWTNSSRTLTGNCSDELSGCSSKTTTKTFSSSTLKASPPNISDNAGNSTTCPAEYVYVDTEAPYAPTLTSITAKKSNTKVVDNLKCETVNNHNECTVTIKCEPNSGKCEYEWNISTSDNLSGVQNWLYKFSSDGTGATTGCSSNWNSTEKCKNTTSGTGATYSTHYVVAKDYAGNINYNLYLKLQVTWRYE